jgi:hypothetical protein
MANANILLHGLFVLQYQGHKLIAMTPPTTHHQFLLRPQGLPCPGPFPALPDEMDFTSLHGSDMQKPFPPGMLQFSKTATGVGDLVSRPGPPKNYKCRIIFNLPLDIMVLRTGGSLSDYHMDPNSAVGKDITANSSSGLGLITLLHYETSGSPFTISIFAEHRTPPHPASMMNPVLAAAANMFSNPANFDLQLADCPTCDPPTICPDNPMPAQALQYGVQQDDERSFGEVYDCLDCAQPAGTDVANCVQYGLLG